MKTSKTKSFFFKNLLFSITSVIIVGSVISVVAYAIERNIVKTTIQKQLLGLAASLSTTFEVEDIKKAKESKDDKDSIHEKLTKKIDLLSKNNPNISQMYFSGVELEDGKKTKMIALPTSLIELDIKPASMFENTDIIVKSIKEMLEVKNPVTTDEYRDSTGTWVSALHPIFDENSNIIAYIGIDMNTNDLNREQNRGIPYLAGVLVIISSLVALIQIFVLKKTFAPMKEIFQAISNIGKGNLDVHISVKSQDEIGQLADNINKMIEQIKKIIMGVNVTVKETISSSQKLLLSTEINKTQNEVILNSSKQIAVESSSQLNNAQEIDIAMNQISNGIYEIAGKTSSLADFSSNMQEQSILGNECMESVVNQMDFISESVNITSEVLLQLGEQSKQIDKIVGIITGIASQTNLLALNAAIEAARAGEQGKGFAVVAEEVRKLAEQSQGFASEISKVISEIQDGTIKAVKYMEEGKTEVLKGKDVVAKSGQAFKAILNSINDITDQISEVSVVSEEISSSCEEVAASISELKEGSGKTSNKAEDISDSVLEQQTSLRDMNELAVDLEKMVVTLEQDISHFKL